MRKNKVTLSAVAAILLVGVLGCGKFGSLLSKEDPGALDAKKLAAETATKDILADPPSPASMVARQLTRLDPEAATLQKTVEELERKAIKEFSDELVEKYKLEKPKPADTKALDTNVRSNSATLATFTGNSPLVFALFQPVRASDPIGVSPNDINFLVSVVSIFNEMLTPALTEKGGISPTKRTQNGNSYTDMTVEIARGDAGATKFGFKMNTRGTNGNRSLDSDMEASVEGKRCPDASGKVDFTIKIKLSGKHAKSSYIQDLTAKVVANTNDDGDVANSTMNINQGIQESVDGRNTYIETEFVINDSGNSTTVSDEKVVRTSQDTGPHPDELAASGSRSAMQAAYSGLALAKSMWQNGGCVKLEAPSPGRVEVNSVTPIPVKVTHKFDGSSVPSKVTAVLSGDKSVTPTSLPTTPGDLTYTAPSEKDKTATIELTSKSKRGGAKLTLNASTGGAASYRIVGGKDAWQTNTNVCDIMKPFTLTGGGFTMKLTGGLVGKYTYVGPFNASGGDTYTISLPDGPGKPGTMSGGGVGCAGGKCKNDSEFYTLTPIEPCE